MRRILLSLGLLLAVTSQGNAQQFLGNIPTDSILCRDTASAGPIEICTLSNGLGLNGSKVITNTLSGDVDGAGDAVDLDELAVEAELEAVLDLADMQGDLPLGTKTSGNYAAGDAEAGNALTGDSATAFFSAGTLEDARVDGSLEADEVNPTLGTQTQGNYVDNVTGSPTTGVAVTHTPAEGSEPAVAFDYTDKGADPALAADTCVFSGDATVNGEIVCEGDTADTFETRIVITDPTADRVFTIPNADSVGIQPLSCGGTDKVSAVSAAGVVTCSTDEGGAGSGDNIRVEDGDDAGTYTAATDVDFGDSGDINFSLNTTPSPDEITATVRADSVALTTDTTGSYAAGDAEAGNALTGDSATAFFSAGALELARGGTGAAPGAADQVIVSDSTSAATWRTLPDSDLTTQKLQYDQATNTFSAGTDQIGGVGKLTIWVPAGSMVARATSGADCAVLYDSGSNDVTVRTCAFDTTTQEFAHFQIAMPKSWNEGTLTFQPIWTNTAGLTTETVVFGLACVAISNDDTMNAAMGTAQTSSDTWLAQNDQHEGPESAAITCAGTPAENDLVAFQIDRTVASDNMSGDAQLIGIKLFYTSNAGTDD